MIFVSTMIYALGKILGFEAAVSQFHWQLKNPGPSSLPAVRAIARLKELDDVQLMVDPACTSIAKARSRAFYAAAMSTADVWVSIDDDSEATADTLDLMLKAARSGGDLVLAPCRLRGQERINVALYTIEAERELLDGARLVRAHAGGLSIAALGRRAMNTLAAAYSPDLSFTDHDGVERLALFAEEIIGGRWFGEDVSFCARVTAAGLVIEALATGVTSHDGQGLLLNEIRTLPGLEAIGVATDFRRELCRLKPYTAPAVRDASAAELLIHSERHRAG